MDDKYLSNKSCIICILARDCEDSLKRNIPKIELLRKYFYNSYVLIVENDSKDSTKDILQNWESSDKNIVLISFDSENIQPDNRKIPFPETGSNRIGRMVNYRNIYMEEINKRKLVSNYVIMIDIDLFDFDVPQIKKALINAPGDWSGLFANGRKFAISNKNLFFSKYYDSYAFVPVNWEGYETTYKQQWENLDLLERSLKKESYVQCKSAFGGIGIYRFDAIRDIKYQLKENKTSNTMEVLCEHIPFNEEVNKKGKLYIVSDLVTWYEKVPFSLGLFISNKRFIKLWEILNRTQFRE